MKKTLDLPSPEMECGVCKWERVEREEAPESAVESLAASTGPCAGLGQSRADSSCACSQPSRGAEGRFANLTIHADVPTFTLCKEKTENKTDFLNED